MKIVFASSNRGKIKEIQSLLAPFNLEVLPQAIFNVDDIEETGLTFVENALLKARHAATVTGLPALADDSGLIVDALSGAPGIYSARYSGDNANAQTNIAKLLSEMASIPDEQRNAAFYCVLTFILNPNDPTPLICEGRWPGKILHASTGHDGFGYDPVFFDPQHQCSAAQLSLDVKNRISHRGQALQSFIKKLSEKLC